MSLLGALNTAISGLNSQSTAFGNISDNVANSQTTGYKRVDTSFTDYLTTSTATDNQSGSVVARPDYVNTVEGGITQTDNPLAMAIDGQGFFAVSEPTGAGSATAASTGTGTGTTSGAASSGTTQFSTQQYYSRDGNFQLNDQGYLVNDSGYYLSGWSVSSSGVVNQTDIAPIKIDQANAAPVPTGTIALAANLPPNTGGSTSTPSPSTITVYDAQGEAHQMTLTFASNSADTWSLSVTDDATPANTVGTAQITFGPNGTLTSIAPDGGGTTGTAGAAATVDLNTVYPSAAGGTQQISLNLGTIGGASGLTQYAGSSFAVQNITQDGTAPGDFSSVSTTSSGAVVVNYDNGTSKTVAQIPVVTFAAPDALQRQDGQAFTATGQSGLPLANSAGSSGSGGIVTSSTEASNVDISTEFSQLIVAQQAYSANAKIVTTASDLLQTTIDMKR